jgi:hypothetical protein
VRVAQADRVDARPAPTPAEGAVRVSPELEELRALGYGDRRGHYTRFRIREPGKALSPELHERLLAMLIRESTVAHQLDMSPYWNSRPDYYHKLHEWRLWASGDEVAGWLGHCTWSTPDGPVMYMDSLAIMPKYRRRLLAGLIGTEAWLDVCREERRIMPITCRAQSALIVRALQRFWAPTVFPSGIEGQSEGARRRAVVIARNAAERLNPDERFDEETFVVRGAYGFSGALYDEPPRCGDRALDDFFARNVDLAAGDGLIPTAVPTWRNLAYVAGLYALVRAKLVLGREPHR